MPELPDLLHVCAVLQRRITGAAITSTRLVEPVILRATVRGDLSLLGGHRLSAVTRVSNFVVFSCGDHDLTVSPMLAGRFRLAPVGAKDEASLGFALALSAPEGPLELRYLDDKRMGKAYLTPPGGWKSLPGLTWGGLDVLGPAFTAERFRALLAARRDQVRACLLDRTALDSLGNAYADEVLFAAGLHPKTWCRRLSAAEADRLHAAIGSVLREAAAEIARRDEPIEVKVRDFLRIRLRKTCPRCGSKVRKAGVKGMDACFCPRCQPPTRASLVDWTKTGR